MDRRGFMQSILAAGIAPWVVTSAGVLMPVRKVIAAPQIILPDVDGVAGDTMSIVQYAGGAVAWRGAEMLAVAPTMFNGDAGLFVHTGVQWIKVYD